MSVVCVIVCGLIVTTWRISVFHNRHSMQQYLVSFTLTGRRVDHHPTSPAALRGRTQPRGVSGQEHIAAVDEFHVFFRATS